MARTCTTSRERAKLAAAGFVRIDGLAFYDNETNRFCGVVEAIDSNHGKFGEEDQTICFTVGREVWIATNNYETPWARQRLVSWLNRRLCPNGSVDWRPFCIFGQNLELRMVLQRMANPDWPPPGGPASIAA